MTPTGPLVRVLAVAAILWAADSPAVAQSEAELRLKGYVPEKCEIEFGGGASLSSDGMDLSVGGSRIHRVGVYCNTPFTGEIRSANGGFLREGGADEPPVDYRVSLEIEGLDLIGPLESAALVAPHVFDSGDAIAIDDNGALTVAWDGRRRLRAGAYEDTLTIRIKPRQ